MIIKGNGVYKLISIVSTFLFISVTLFYTSVTAFASDYSDINDTVYRAANYFSLDELPFGEDTAVLQIQYNTRYITFFIDKLSVFDDFDKSNIDVSSYETQLVKYLKDHYITLSWVQDSNGNWDYHLHVVSDSQVYYIITYSSSTSLTENNLGLETRFVIAVNSLLDGTTIHENYSQSYYVQTVDINLSDLVSWSVPDDSSKRSVYCNSYIMRSGSNDYVAFPPLGSTEATYRRQGQTVGYNLKYYPSHEYLIDTSIRESLNSQYELLDIISIDVTDILNEMYTVNDYLDLIYGVAADIESSVAVTEMYVKGYLAPTLLRIESLLKGPEYDSSSGIGSNTEFGDSAGGLMQDTVVPDVGTQSIATSLGNSFLFIRNMFDRVTSEFNLTYVISFLLGLSFIAYTLGRAISNKMNR